jgi:hypothetical protein
MGATMMERTALENGQRFGNWVYNDTDLTLDLYNENNPTGYVVFLEEIYDAASMLDWIFSACATSEDDNGENNNVFDLVKAFDFIFKAQNNLCPSGKNRKQLNVSEFPRGLAKR